MKETLYKYLANPSGGVTVFGALEVMIVALMLSMVIFLTYKITFSGVMYNRKFNVSLVMLTLVTTMVMIVIGSDIALSLGMVGALSIVRFRTAIKDPRDTAYIILEYRCRSKCRYRKLYGSSNWIIILTRGIIYV